MRPVTKSQTGVGQTAWIPIDYLQTAFAVGFGVVASGTVTYTVEHTFDNVLDPTVTPTAFTNETLTNQTTSQDGNYAFPIRAIRVNVTAGTGSATITVLQGNSR